MSSSSVTSPLISQTIALAAMAQAITLVQSVAWKNRLNEADFRPLLLSLLKKDAPSAAAVYDGTFELSRGLRKIRSQLDAQSDDKDPEFVSLLINILVLQKQLSANKAILNKLGQKIDTFCETFQQVDSNLDPETLKAMIRSASDIYRSTLSQLPNRIQVRGEPAWLKDDFNQACIRAALLTAVRAAFMWRQCGGSRWHFLFKRQKILRATEQLIHHPLGA